MVLTAYAALSLATNSSCHHHRRINGSAKPGWARNTSADLTPATGARTTRFCRPPQRRSSARRLLAHGSKDPPCNNDCAPALPRPPHPIPTSVTIMIRPSFEDETARVLILIWVRRKQEYFCWRDLTGKSLICPSGKNLQRAGWVERPVHQGQVTITTSAEIA